MALIDVRHRAGYLFLAILLGHVILISAQVQSRSGVPMLEAVAFGIFAEVQRGMSAVITGVRESWGSYVGLRGVRAENEILKRELADAQVALQQQRALADRTRSLEKLLDFRDRTNLTMTAAEIVAAAAAPDFRTVTIDKGTRQGLRPDMPVIAPAGIVGRVVVPSANAAMVQLLIDRNAAAGAIIDRRESRAQGLIVGTGEDRLSMEYVPETADVTVGDTVVSSGIDGIYPKGFIIGRVEVVDKIGPAYKRILVRPAVDFTSLEEVLIVLSPRRESPEEHTQ